uniref:Uncharacterized protein n=1 Tax=Amphimedon queenslandica TaxID=400682 RepID=A0A1X7VD78_AMPQE
MLSNSKLIFVRRFSFSHMLINLFSFSHNGKQHSCAQLISYLTSLFTGVSCLTKKTIFANPEVLVQKRINHHFEENGELKWFKETVLEYKNETGEYRVVYENEDSEYNYLLLDEIANDEIVYN